MSITFRAAVVSFVLATVAARSGYGCSCVPSRGPCSAFAPSDAVFVGRVVEVTEVKGQDDVVTMEISEVFKGVERGLVQVLQGGGGTCSPRLDIGQRWLIYAQRDDAGRLVPQSCRRTVRVEQAAEDLVYLRNPMRDALPTSLWGHVRVYYPARMAGEYEVPLADVDVTLTDASGRATQVRTNGTGRYEATGLPPGDYTVRVSPPAHLKVHDSGLTVHLWPHACAGEDLTAVFTGSIEGRVVDANGQPVEHLDVGAAPLEAMNGGEFLDEAGAKERTAGDGSFVIDGLPPGRYIVGVNLTTEGHALHGYAPAAATAGEAAVVQVGLGEHVRGVDVRLSHAFARIVGTVLNADGTPLAGADVFVRDPEPHTGITANMFRDTTSDARGHFALDVIFETAGTLVVRADDPGRPIARYIERPLAFQPGKVTTVTVVMPPD